MDKNEEILIEKYPMLKELSDYDKQVLFAMMQSFQEAAHQTISEGEELLKMCDGCAYKKGTEASAHPMTVLVATESVLKAVPFYCHKRFCRNGEEKLCSGWINVMNNR